jgi:DNA N6-methyl adenine demethylase
MYGPPRYQWEHSVLREDITSRRVCIAYREFTPKYLEGGCAENDGQVIIDAAKHFW